MLLNTLKPLPNSHKSQNGKVLAYVGSSKYRGAGYFALATLRYFVDLVYHIGECSYHELPEVIQLSDCGEAQPYDVYLAGCGLSFVQLHDVDARWVVLDAAAIKHLNEYENVVITPHKNEFRRVFGVEPSVQEAQTIAADHHVTILLKRPEGDVITDGTTTEIVRGGTSFLTRGGTGDVLAGLTAAFLTKLEPIEACFLASTLLKTTSETMEWFCTSDLIKQLPRMVARL